MSLTNTLIQKVNALTTMVNSIIQNAKKIGDLDDATLPLDAGDLVAVSQSGVSRKVTVDNLGGGSSITKFQYQEFLAFGPQGNTSQTMQAGDMVMGWFSSTEFFKAAIYNGGVTTTRTNFTVIDSVKF